MLIVEFLKQLEIKMLARHANQLLNLLERVADVGCAEVTKVMVLHWYSQERMTVGVWRDLQEKWEEVLEQTGNERTIPLLVGDAPGLWVLVWGQGLKEVDETAWLKDVAGLSKRKVEEAQLTA
ncbi:hypothetical protein ABIB83_006476 [Bradyrhizobium sp. I1.8.5]|uniref:hypothetical protein n=1 Tax=Bradyrhizobium sp. I1.8.5 TaxID=3156365 RepID=UPI0033912187